MIVMEQGSGIRRGVSFYSYQDLYRQGRLSLEDCIRVSSEMGIEGIEIIGDQMIPGSPFPDESFFNQWRDWIKQYDVQPVCHDMYINTNLYKNRTLTKRECVKALVDEMRLANRLGISMIRMNAKTPTDIILPALPAAEELGVVMAQEIHAGYGMNHPFMVRYAEIMQKANSPYIGLVPDMGLFIRKFPRVVRDMYLSLGLNPAVADLVDSIFDSGQDLRGVSDVLPQGSETPIPDMFRQFDLSDIDAQFVHYAWRFENNDLGQLRDVLPYTRNIHAKFYEMTEEGRAYSIPYQEIIDLLKAENYNGFICSEYEGNRFVPEDQESQEILQVGRQQQMLKDFIGSPTGSADRKAGCSDV